MRLASVITALVFCGMTSGLLAQREVPKALAAAKRVYIVNVNTGPDGVKEEVTKAINEWGRFTVVDKAASSDITITMGKPRPFQGMPMTITDSKSKAVLWEASNKNIWGWPAAARSLVNRLRDYIKR